MIEEVGKINFLPTFLSCFSQSNNIWKNDVKTAISEII
nr:MAG TPA: hypothetical protein [Caudoviricetes sp.]